MSQRVLAIVEQPCVLCEATIQLWTLYRDDEVDREQWVVVDKDHYCTELALEIKR